MFSYSVGTFAMWDVSLQEEQALEACKRALERPGGQIFILQATVTVHGCVNG